jgi:transposase, IS5 family
MQKTRKKHASKVQYVSPSQMTMEGFETPFSKHLDPSNRWVIMSKSIPWDEICSIYHKQFGSTTEGPKPINGRIIIGALIIKHMLNLDDRETIDQIKENVYMQHFLGYSSFTTETPFDPSLFVTIRNRLGMEELNAINEKILTIKTKFNNKESKTPSDCQQKDTNKDKDDPPENKGRVIFDATACPQGIAYPTDLNLLSDAREKSEELIDKLYHASLHAKKPRTYREVARKNYLQTAQMKNKTGKKIRKAVKKQLGYLDRNIYSINKLLDAYHTIPLDRHELKYFFVIQTLFQQQKEMYQNGVHSIDDRIVSIHQPHVRPMVRGKSQAKVEFGSKIHISLIDGITFLDQLCWDAFNEGSHMMQYVEQYRKRFGFYPKEILADKIYCTRENRQVLKGKGISLIAKPLGRPSAVAFHIRPGERNPVEGKFGQAKTAYGLNRIRARLKDTSQSWIASIILVLNLVKLTGAASLFLINKGATKFYIILKKWEIMFLELFPIEKIFPWYVLGNSG